MTDLATAALNLRSAHHLAVTARRHGNVGAWAKWTRREHQIRRLIDTGRTPIVTDDGEGDA